jgi:hypothetical protein
MNCWSINNSCSLPFCLVCGRLWSCLSTTHAVWLSAMFVVVCDHVYQQLMQSTFLSCLWSSVIMSINNSCSLTFCVVCGRLWSCLSTAHAVYLSVLSVVVCDHVYQQLMQSTFLSCLWSVKQTALVVDRRDHRRPQTTQKVRLHELLIDMITDDHRQHRKEDCMSCW